MSETQKKYPAMLLWNRLLIAQGFSPKGNSNGPDVDVLTL